MEYWNVGIRQYWVKKQIGNDKIQMPNQIQTPKEEPSSRKHERAKTRKRTIYY
jgi:hypothetical protein